jgi:broad specificity phosphatase PhoE
VTTPRLVLIRHGQSEGNALGIVQGRLDFRLTTLGVRQSLAVAEHARGLDAARLFSSPLLRARHTADAVAACCGLTVEVDGDLIEYDAGEISGLTVDQIRRRYPSMVAAYQSGALPLFPGEEGRAALDRRATAVFARLRSLDGTTVVVAHAGVISALCRAVDANDEPVPSARDGLAVSVLAGTHGIVSESANCSITEIAAVGGRMVVVRRGDDGHAADLRTLDNLI